MTSERVPSYPAKTAYAHARAPVEYERRAYYRGWLGAYRKAREVAAVRAALGSFEARSVILDCPCGNGRWFDTLAVKAGELIGVDVSDSMLDFARQRPVQPGLRRDVRRGDAEALELEDRSVDHVFSYALMKHLPRPRQAAVLREFARVSRGPLAVSFALLSPLSTPLWRLRRRPFANPLQPGELERMARGAGLRVESLLKVGIPLGLETLVLLGRR